MKDEIVSFETAKLAKEKGFNLRGEVMYATTQQLEPFNLVKWDLYRDYCLAPTQSLLQRWLRENHNLHIEIKVEDMVSNPKYYWDIFGKYKEINNIMCLENSGGKDGFFSTYEEALEDCLRCALNRI